MYRSLYNRFGPQHWWPADSPFEVMVGSILTQNTSWANVEKAINNLKRKNLLAPRKLYGLSLRTLAAYLRPCGYYNVKAKRLKNFLSYFIGTYAGGTTAMARQGTERLRRELLAVSGIGPETADSILLYALHKPVFVVDAYTKRILSRHAILGEQADYHAVQAMFMRTMKPDVRLCNEYHALLVRLGKEYCHKRKPRCIQCPLKVKEKS